MLGPITIGVRAFQVSSCDDRWIPILVPLEANLVQFLFAVVVLGLAVTLLKQQRYGNSPTTTRYSIFTGAFGMIVAVVGAIGLFLEAIPAIVPMALDAVSGILLAAGGIAWAVGLKGIQCKLDDAEKMYDSPLLNEGCVTTSGGGRPYCGVLDDANGGKDAEALANRLKGNCQKAFTGEIFQFLTFALAAILVALGFLTMRRGGTSGSRFVA